MRQLFALAGIVLLISACKHDDNEPIRKFTSFQADSLIVLAENPTAVLSPANLTDNDATNDYPILHITATGNHGESIRFSLISGSSNIQPGNYSSTIQGNSMRLGFEGIDYNLQANYTYGELNFNISKVVDTLIEGSFDGELVDSTGTISPKTLRKGFIRAVFVRDTL
ncbi:hypothetical protein [Chitinophaga sp.]|uniref:hypothetical protein n=1 Tax=Chitinophaga sp. TaxID=1869181 RepID=UPI0031CE5C63